MSIRNGLIAGLVSAAAVHVLEAVAGVQIPVWFAATLGVAIGMTIVLIEIHRELRRNSARMRRLIQDAPRVYGGVRHSL